LSTKQRLPQDIANLLARCIRDLIWYKTPIFSFLEECGVPKSIMIEVRRQRDLETLKMVPALLERLYERGDEGFQVARTMLTKIYYWKDIHSVPADRKDQAIESLKALQAAYKTYVAQAQYEQEKKSQLERESRLQISKLDHKKLQSFRDRFDEIYFLEQKDRGDAYEKLMNDVFAYYFPDAFQGFNRTGEQLDGQFYFDSHWYYVEVRWRKEPANAGDVSILRDRAVSGFGDDVRAVFISYNDFSDDCKKSLEVRGERVMLLTGYDLRSVFECDIAFDVLLHRIQAYLIKNKVNYVGARKIIEEC
jgi:Restriction endonuclease